MSEYSDYLSFQEDNEEEEEEEEPSENENPLMYHFPYGSNSQPFEIDFLLNSTISEASQFTLSENIFSQVQKKLTLQNRYSVVDWLIRVTQRINFSRSILFNSVFILDQYLSKKEIDINAIQLAATTCLLISTKLDQVLNYNLELNYFVTLCQKKFTAEQFRDMEKEIIETIGFQLNFPTSLFFVDPFLGIFNQELTPLFHVFVQFLLDCSLTSFKFNEFPTPLLSASAIYITAMLLDYHCPITSLCMAAQIKNPTQLKEIGTFLVNCGMAVMSKGSGGIFSEYQKKPGLFDILANARATLSK